MSDERARALWDAKADEWAAWTGPDGDANRRFITDRVLHRMLGEVRGLRVLDAGCGVGYLAARMVRDGAAEVTAIDASPRMVEHTIARGVSARVDDAQTLATVPDRSVDRVVSNFVLMDVPDLDGAVSAIARVLVPGGVAVLVFSHPCFSEWGAAPVPYPQERAIEERWGPFETPFVHFHRPLARYVGALRAAGLALDALEEPVLDRTTEHGFDPERAERWATIPMSIAIRAIRA